MYGTYSQNHNSPNNTGCNDERSPREEGHEGDLSFQADLDRPEEGKRDGEEVDVCNDVEDHDDENVYVGVGWLTEICADMVI